MAPSAHARFRIISVVTERLRARAIMLHMINRFPGTPRRKTMARMKAPIANEAVESGTVPSRRGGWVVLFIIIRKASAGNNESTLDLLSEH